MGNFNTPGEGKPEYLMVADAYLLPVSSVNAQKLSDYLQPIFFQFLPTIQNDQEQADYQSVSDSLGRAEQFNIYKGGQNKELSLNATFAAVDKTYDEFWVQQQVNRLKSLTKPLYDRDENYSGVDSRYFAPPLVLFSYGWLYVNIPVVVTSVQSSIPDETGIQLGTNLPRVVTVDITMKTNYPYGYVPGYLNFYKQFNVTRRPATNFNEIFNPKQLSFGGGISINSGIAQTLQSLGVRSTLGSRSLSEAGISVTEV